jgi:hypothetical protein
MLDMVRDRNFKKSRKLSGFCSKFLGDWYYILEVPEVMSVAIRNSTLFKSPLELTLRAEMH